MMTGFLFAFFMCVSLHFNSALFLVPYLYVFICLCLFAYFAHSKTEAVFLSRILFLLMMMMILIRVELSVLVSPTVWERTVVVEEVL